MKLTGQERRILAYYELHADEPVAKLARRLKVRPHTIHYTMHKLESAGVVRRVPFINMFALGFQDYAIYFSLAALAKSKRDALIKTLVASSAITFLAEFGGDWQYGLAVYAPSVTEFLKFLDGISEKFTDVFFQKSFSIRLSLTRFNRQYLFPDVPRNALTGKVTIHPVTIDATDKKILAALSQMSALSHREIAMHLHLPFSTLHARVQALERRGILGGSTYFIDTNKLGFHMFEVLVYTKGLNPTLRTALYDFAFAHANTTYLVHCLGEWDFEIGLEVHDPAEANAFVEGLYETFGAELQTVKILPMFKYLRYGFYRG